MDARNNWLFSGLHYALSLADVVIHFGYGFFGTDLLAHKGAAAAVPFPAFIGLMGCMQIVLVRVAARRGWVHRARRARAQEEWVSPAPRWLNAWHLPHLALRVDVG